MLYCFDYGYIEPTNYLFLYLSWAFIGLILYSLRYWPRNEEVDRRKISEDQIINYDKDILGLEVPVYEKPVKNQKTMRGLGLKTGMFIIIAFLASMLIFKSYEKVEPFRYVGNNGHGWGEPTFVETGNSKTYIPKLSLYDEVDFQNSLGIKLSEIKYPFDTTNLSIKYINEPYYQYKDSQ